MCEGCACEYLNEKEGKWEREIFAVESGVLDYELGGKNRRKVVFQTLLQLAALKVAKLPAESNDEFVKNVSLSPIEFSRTFVDLFNRPPMFRA